MTNQEQIINDYKSKLELIERYLGINHEYYTVYNFETELEKLVLTVDKLENEIENLKNEIENLEYDLKITNATLTKYLK